MGKLLPDTIFGGAYDTGHVQGIALDKRHEYVYYSFTTLLVKTDLTGRLIGTVGGLTGHLGCIAFNDEDGRLYGSLEYKHDAIGEGIRGRTGRDLAEEDAFYAAIFDVERITRPGMDAEKDGVMTAVWLPDVVEDYAAVLPDGTRHRYGCSGIDGASFGPVFGETKDSARRLMICCGIYGDETRRDNDYNILLSYDWRAFAAVARPLSQAAPHHSGVRAGQRYFLPTGNTTYGIQNLEYDSFSGDWFVAVYPGTKPEYPNYAMYVIDGSAPARRAPLQGLCGEEGLVLSLKAVGERDARTDQYGSRFPWGSTGIYSLGDGRFYFSQDGRTPPPASLHTCLLQMYRFDASSPALFEKI